MAHSEMRTRKAQGVRGNRKTHKAWRIAERTRECRGVICNVPTASLTPMPEPFIIQINLRIKGVNSKAFISRKEKETCQ
jgi:hypothetical protein